MTNKKKKAWIDKENHILAFYPFEGSVMFSKCENEFWDCIMVLVKKGYRVM